MFRLIDRLLIFSYIKSYLICLVSLLGLYVIVDLFNNIDEFFSIEGGFWATLKHIGLYYGCQLTIIFDRLSEAIVLLAAMFTVAWTQRNNEILPLLSAGASTRRVVRPVLFSACAFVMLNMANQELLIPRIGAIMPSKGDPNKTKLVEVQGSYDVNGVHLSGHKGLPKDQVIRNFTCVIPVSATNQAFPPLHAAEAKYIPPGIEEHTGGWLLTGTDQKQLKNWNREDILEQIAPGKFFLYTDVDFKWLTRKKSFWDAKSILQLLDELEQAEPHQLASIAVVFHMRLTRPLLGIILVLMGLGVILRDQNRHVFISIGFCLVLCVLFFTAVIGSRYLGDHELLSPAMAAWLPVFLFGPLAFVLFDAVHT